MPLLAAYAVPHPPLIVPAVGKGEEQKISDTIAAYEEVARRVATHRPDTVVLTSPHAPLYRDGFFVSDAQDAMGSMIQFGQPDTMLSVPGDPELANAITARARAQSIQTVGSQYERDWLDHGTFVPLHFLENSWSGEPFRLVRVGLSGLSAEDHEQLGRIIVEAANALGRRAILVASGDWSHKLTEDGPYGFAPEGPKFDAAVADLFRKGNLPGLFELDEALCEGAAECGLRSFWIMAGALQAANEPFTSELLSYEGPFGVGYGVAAFELENAPESTEDEVAAEVARTEQVAIGKAAAEADNAYPAAQTFAQDVAAGTDPLVALARLTVESFAREGTVPVLPADLPIEMTGRRAGAFVSLHTPAGLRGCIGTIQPTTATLAEEVQRNAVAACSQDPRFAPVTADELGELSYSVDVLSAPEQVESVEQLDPKRFGVIVSRGWNRGLLLPDLEGVDTVEDQIAIAKRKAGIAPDEDARLERFEVTRHDKGGEARS